MYSVLSMHIIQYLKIIFIPSKPKLMSHKQTTPYPYIFIQAILLIVFGLILKNIEDNFGNLMVFAGVIMAAVWIIYFFYRSVNSFNRKRQTFRLK